MSEEVKLSKSAKDKEKQAQDEAKLKTLETVLGKIEKTYGKGAVMNMAARPTTDVNVIPTGSINLDHALGVGGYPRGRIIEIYGPESSGKTTLAIHAIAEVQKQGGKAIIIDAEHAFDPSYAEALGVDMDSLYISQPDNGEQALDIAEQVIRSGAVDLVIIDSVAALVPKQEIEGDMGETKVGLQARLMSQALRKITGAISKSNTACIFINQLREKIGVFFGSPETTTGGKALKFYASVRIDVRRAQTLKDGDQPVGNRTKAKVVKNKMAPPFKQAEFDILYGQGISREGGLLDLGVENGIVRKSGSWYTYGSDQLGQGKENARTFLKDNPELASEIETKILASLGIGEAGRRAREEAAAAEAEAALEAAAQAESKAPAKPAPARSSKSGPAKSASKGGSAKPGPAEDAGKGKEGEKTGALDIDAAFGEDAGDF